MMAGQTLRMVRLALWLGVALAAGVLLYQLTAGNRPAEGAGQTTDFASSIGGPFTLTAADGSTVTDETLAGKPYAIFFGFTRCPDVCPTSLNRLAQLRQRLGEDGDRFEIVFVSVDPGHDDPEDVGRYVDLFGTPILGLTGTDEQIDRATRAFGVFHQQVPIEGGGYTVDHTASVFLMDEQGRLQSIIDYHESPDASLAKLERLVA